MKQNTFIYKTFAKVLKLDENKTKLLKLTAGTLKKLSKNQQKILVIDWLETTILSNQKVVGRINMQADDRVIMHVIEQSQLVFGRLMIFTVGVHVDITALLIY